MQFRISFGQFYHQFLVIFFQNLINFYQLPTWSIMNIFLGNLNQFWSILTSIFGDFVSVTNQSSPTTNLINYKISFRGFQSILLPIFGFLTNLHYFWFNFKLSKSILWSKVLVELGQFYHPILHHFWLILSSFLVHFWFILNSFLVHFWFIFGSFLVYFSRVWSI